MNSKAGKRLVPKLRFPEFRGDEGWSERSLGEVCNVLQGIGFPDRLQGKLQGRYPFCKVSDVSKAVNEVGGVLSAAANYVDDEEILEIRAKLIPIGSTVFAKIGEALRLNRRAITSAPCLIDNNVTGLKAKTGQATDGFVFYLMQRMDLNEYCGGVVPSINKTTLENINIQVPILQEQGRIADCLSSIEDLITAQAQNVEALKAHKTGLMQQLFPAEGETVPRLRFPEFRDSGKWIAITVGQIADFQSGGTPSKENPVYWNGSIPWVSAKDMKQLFLDDTEDHITTAAINDGAKQARAGAVLMLTRGMTLLKDIPICILSRQMTFNQDIKALHAKGDFDGCFLAYLLLSNKQRLLSMVDIAGHGTGRLDTDKLKTFEVMLPQVAEQRSIADCFTSLDNLIDVQTQKIDALKVHKIGLMQGLFPSMSEAEA
ncbi:restriction endonuclease subunit S [Candidatus Accumulibacter contiguus]|jgi:type I restriction enzyme S subunit|uniref:restriction endonuclease subunit S n=1 Tax=Candidatus Accumulibacter contiguus TaxID=2954381 RepID=UPI002FC2DD64